MRIFLTGGTGSIGTPVLQQAIAAGHEVCALARSAQSAQMLEQAGAEALDGNLAEPERWMARASEADVLIHLASSFDDTMAETEPRLIESLIRHAGSRNTPLRVLYTGGCWLYGQTGRAVAHEVSPLNPIAPFAWATRAIERLTDQPALSCAIIHPAMVYDETGGVFSRYMTALRRQRPVPIWGNARTRWPLVHRDDVAAAFLLLAERPDQTGSFNVVAETGVQVDEIAAHLSEAAGLRAPPAVLPAKWVRARHGPWAQGPMLDQQMRSTRLPALGWSPRFADFTDVKYRF